MSQYRILLISLVAAIVTGCASNSIPDPDAGDGGMDSSNAGDTSGYDGSSGMADKKWSRISMPNWA